MPWTPADAALHTDKADTPRKRKIWSATANTVLKKTGDEARAIKEANSVVASGGRTQRHRISRWL